ncbi:AbrB/MazE/SpoVT family DNA-binding domain-containing protein [Poseidonibacter sp.]|uniref:AbrB/MazE/SpoVT family DNA-binding domain-containing protein n=1 Tax=Poseidonibacter sp. TaxID=2321188 RepID=UPI00359D1383
MTMLTKIGNSKGVRIPKSIIQQAHLEGVHLEFEVLKEGVLIKPIINNSRETWVDNISNTIKKSKSKEDEALLEDFLNDSDLEDFQW